MDLNQFKNVRAWTDGVEVEHEAAAQIRNIASLPIVAGHVAVMPDVHLGKGATVGSVIPTRGAIIPAAVGVDIGCGMCAVRTELAAGDLPDSLARVRSAVESLVPVGFEKHDKPVSTFREGLFGIALKRKGDELYDRYQRLHILDRVGKFDHARVWNQLGTLGGGNHFIELCLDEDQRVWVMLHSGSRNVGKTIGETAITMARSIALREQRHLPDRDLAWLDEGTAEFDEYVTGLRWAQDYAAHNRNLMLHAVLKALREEFSRKLAGRHVGTTKHAVNCFAGETMVMTRHGRRSIRELAGRQHELLTEGGTWVSAPVRSFGSQWLMKVTLSRSGVLKTIRATSNHRWLLHNRQRKLTETTTRELRPGNRLRYVFPSRASTLSPDRKAVARGFVFGDGSVTHGKAVANFCGDKDKYLLPYFNDCKAPRTYASVTRITGLPCEWKITFPNLDEPQEVLYGWLAGYFAADGDVGKTGRPTLASAKRENLEFVRDLCTAIGVGTFGVRVRLRSGFGAEATPIYLLGIMRGDLCERFFIVPAHRERFLGNRHAAERRSWNVVAVEDDLDREDVYCAVVEGTHSFALADNILTRNCHHNYAALEEHFGDKLWITRKGAVSARAGELGIIPGSMGARSFIVRGKGNADAYCSCSHGAGRRMSRSAAKRQFSVDDLRKQTEGVECRKDSGVVDEIPGAYKDIDAVMAAQADLVEVVHTLKQVMCVKG